MLALIAQGTTVVDIQAQATSISPVQTIGKLVEIGAGAVLAVAGLAVLMYLLLGGFSWLTAGGDKSKVEHAREMITQAIIGIAILASVFAVYTLILKMFGINSISVSGSGGGGSSANCSDWCAGTTLTGAQYHPDQCENAGGHQVAERCSGGKCAGNTYPCLVR